MERDFWNNNPEKIHSKIFPEEFHFKPSAHNKTRTFYEFILIDSDSVAIKHYKNPQGESEIAYTIIQVLKVISPKQFGKDLNQPKKFSKLFDPIGYNYWAIDAWRNVAVSVLGIELFSL